MNTEQLMELDYHQGRIPASEQARPIEAFVECVLARTSGKTYDNKTEFRALFFPSLVSPKYDIETACPGDYDKWNQALVIGKLVSETGKSQVNQERVKQNLREMNETFRQYGTDVYIACIRRLGLPAPEEYKEQLCSIPWRSRIALKQSQGVWENGEWDMYLHWVKLCACGGGQKDIEEIYSIITTREPRISLAGMTGADPGHWKEYAAWHTKDIDGSFFSIQNASGFYQTSGSCYTGGYAYNYTDNHYYADEFISRCGYWQSGCCLSADTRVGMEDGRFVPVSRLRKGDRIRSVGGTRTVAYLSTPDRSGRPLYRIPGTLPAFTEDHPILLYQKDVMPGENGGRPLLGFVSPAKALEAVPQFGTVGAVALSGSVVCGMENGREVPISVQEPETCAEGTEGEILYDVILEPDGSDFDAYLVGEEEKAFFVLTEIPFLKGRELTGFVILSLLEAVQAEGDGDVTALYPGHPVFGRLRGLFARMGQEGTGACDRKAPAGDPERQGDAYNGSGDWLHRRANQILVGENQFRQVSGRLLDLMIAELSEPLQRLLCAFPEELRERAGEMALEEAVRELGRVIRDPAGQKDEKV